MNAPSADLFRSVVQRARSVADGGLKDSTGSTLAGKRDLGGATVLEGLATGEAGLADGTCDVGDGLKVAAPVGIGIFGACIALEGNTALFGASSGFATKVGAGEP